jgi:hypothetical protein
MTAEQPSLGDVIAALLDEAGDIEAPISREYAREGVAFFARPAENEVEIRLGDEIAEAALRTPDTTASPRGPAWVRFAPPTWDEFAFDRVEAWFRVAWRMAAKGKR